MFKVIVLVTSIASASCVARLVAQNPPLRAITMNDLTVPKKRLPEGCSLSTTPYLVEGNRVL
jgi:hypothetical protein